MSKKKSYQNINEQYTDDLRRTDMEASCPSGYSGCVPVGHYYISWKP